MAGLTPRDHTRNVLARMDLAASVPPNIDRNNDATGDNYGLTAARSSDASSFKMSGAPKSPHMGRPGRQAGGRISGDLLRTRRTPTETAADIASEDKVIDALAKDRKGRAEGGRIGRWKGGPGRDVLGQKDVYAEEKPEWLDTGIPGQKEYYNFLRGGLGHTAVGAPKGQGGIGSDVTAEPTNQASGGRVGRARGGRTTKGKTTVNVIIGGGPEGAASRMPAPPPPMPPPMPPPAGGPPPRPPMPMPPPPMAAAGPVGPPRPGMPVGGAPMGPMGAPPPGVPPMLRARGGRIEISTPGVHDYGKAGVKHGKVDEEYGGGSGLGRQEKARRQK